MNNIKRLQIKVSNNIRPYRSKIIIVFMLCLLALSFPITELIETRQLEKFNEIILFVSTVIIFWCLGLLELSLKINEKENWFVIQYIPNISLLIEYIYLMFVAIWFLGLTVVTLVMPVVLW